MQGNSRVLSVDPAVRSSLTCECAYGGLDMIIRLLEVWACVGLSFKNLPGFLVVLDPVLSLSPSSKCYYVLSDGTILG